MNIHFNVEMAQTGGGTGETGGEAETREAGETVGDMWEKQEKSYFRLVSSE